jgi:hypothetical protein
MMNTISGRMDIRRGWWAAVAAAAIVALLASAAGAQVFYMYPGAPPVKADQPAAGVNIGFGDNLFRTLGYGRFNVNSASDIGIELVFDNTDTAVETDKWRIGLAADYKYAIIPDSTDMPFDLSVNGGFGFQSGGDMKNILIPVGGLISGPLELSNGQVLVPYGGVYVLIAYSTWDLPLGATGDTSKWDTDVELRGGAAYHINKTAAAYASLFIGAGTKFYVGINFLL